MSFRTILVPLALIVTAQAFGTVVPTEPQVLSEVLLPVFNPLNDVLPKVTIRNSTPYKIIGKKVGREGVMFVSAGCFPQPVPIVEASHTWTAEDRGGCLLSGISVRMLTDDDPEGGIECQPFKSSFSTLGSFAVLTTPAGGCEVSPHGP